MLSVFRAALLCQGLWLVCDPLLAAHNPSQLFARLLITQTRIRPCNHKSGRDRAATSRADSVHPSTQPRYSTLRPSRTCIVSAAQPLCVRNTTKSHRRTRSKRHFPKNRSDSCQINVATAKAKATLINNLIIVSSRVILSKIFLEGSPPSVSSSLPPIADVGRHIQVNIRLSV